MSDRKADYNSFTSFVSEEKQARQRRRGRIKSALFAGVCGLATLICVGALVGLISTVIFSGAQWLSWGMLTNYPSPSPERAGILSALMGSLWLIGLTAAISVPLGIGAAIYLEEYASASRWRKLVQLNIANLAGVPSIVYGILGLGLFVRAMSLERSILSGALTLTLVVLPIVILSAQEALRSVPGSIRQASFALGATKWQTVWHQVLPAALPGMMTGVILAIARALGEAAPLVVISGAAYVPFMPTSLGDQFTALPLLIYDWAGRPNADFHGLASGAIIVLLMVLIVLNAGAVLLRYRYSKRIKW